MPLLFYGRVDGGKRALYGKGLRPIETPVFDSFKVRSLAPSTRLAHVANFWHFMDRKHTALSWHEDDKEQTIFLPGFLGQMDALELSRLEFSPVMPPALTFRWNNENEVYSYHD